jgi:hypothetical protein
VEGDLNKRLFIDPVGTSTIYRVEIRIPFGLGDVYDRIEFYGGVVGGWLEFEYSLVEEVSLVIFTRGRGFFDNLKGSGFVTATKIADNIEGEVSSDVWHLSGDVFTEDS